MDLDNNTTTVLPVSVASVVHRDHAGCMGDGRQWWTEEQARVSNPQAVEHSGKVMMLIELVCQILARKHQLLIFTQSLVTMRLIEEILASGEHPWNGANL